jgi:C4-dicarboxylate-specific signal transduction histidine kinase
VRDTGPGIPADALSKIFDPFFTTKDVEARAQGLGLYIVQIIRDTTAASPWTVDRRKGTIA